MTEKQKQNIIRLSREGKGYRAIAAELDLPPNSVKSWCRRHLCNDSTMVCRHCGILLAQTPHKREKKFCSDKCRMAWWSAHPESRTVKTSYAHVCSACGKQFSNNRINAKFCCRTCFANAREKVKLDG